MKGAILIFGSNKNKRKLLAENLLVQTLSGNVSNNPDLLLLEKEKTSIGIKQIRDAIKFINQKPFVGNSKAVVCFQAHLMTQPAQNALLKTLEELPNYATFVLCAKNLDAMLPTIVSRCQRVDAVKEILQFEEKQSAVETSAANILLMSAGERLTWADETSKEEKEEIIEQLEQQIRILQLELRKVQSKEIVNTINTILKVKQDIESTNINTKLALEHLALEI